MRVESARPRPTDDALEPHQLSRPPVRLDARPQLALEHRVARRQASSERGKASTGSDATRDYQDHVGGQPHTNLTLSSRERASLNDNRDGSSVVLASRGDGGYARWAMEAARIRTGAVAIALTTLVCVVAIAGREPLRGTPGERTETRHQPADVVVPPPSEFPVAGALPPDVFVIEPDEEPGAPAWLLWTIAASTLAAALAALVVLARDLRGRVVAPSAPPRPANGAGDDRGSALQQGR